MCYSPDFVRADRKIWHEEVEKQKKVIRVTSELGGKFCRILSGQKWPDVTKEEGVKLVVEAINSCLPTAEEHDIILVIENHYKDSFWKYPEFAQKKDVFTKIVNQIDSPYFGIQFDPSNSIMAGEDPIDLLQAIKHRVRTMHASDRYLEPGTPIEELTQSNGTIGYPDKLHHGVTGEGLNDYDKIFSILKEVNFQGWISIEDGMNGMEEMKKSMDFLRNMRKKYFG
jgi:sugar phosphate isomerase/epimerase